MAEKQEPKENIKESVPKKGKEKIKESDEQSTVGKKIKGILSNILEE